MVRIPLVPAHVQDRIQTWLMNDWGDRLWRLFVVGVLMGIAYLMLSSAGAFLATLAGIIIGIVIADDVAALISDFWNRNWAEVSTNLFAVGSAIVLVASVTAVPVAPASGQQADMVAIDDDHPLATEQAVAEYRTSGAVSGSLTAPSLRLAVADDHERVGLDGAHVDTDTVWFRLQYNESIERTLRIFLPAGYWHPYPLEITAENADVTATLRPTEDGQYTAITVTVSEPTDAVFGISRVGSATYAWKDYAKEAAENSTGVELPSLGGTSYWDRVQPTQFANGSVVKFDESERAATIQYNSGESDDPAWIPVPACDTRAGENAPYCSYVRPENESQRVVVANAARADLPALRYQYETGVGASVNGWVDDLTQAPGRLPDFDDISAGDIWPFRVGVEPLAKGWV
jgi:hypothetical protein